MSVSVSVIMAMKNTCNLLEYKVFSFSESSFMSMKASVWVSVTVCKYLESLRKIGLSLYLI